MIFHLAARFFHLPVSGMEPELTASLLKNKVVGIAYETVVGRDGRSSPLLQPMSEVAGRMSIQVAARFLEKIHQRQRQLSCWRCRCIAGRAMYRRRWYGRHQCGENGGR